MERQNASPVAKRLPVLVAIQVDWVVIWKPITKSLQRLGQFFYFLICISIFFSQELDSKRQERAGSGEKRKREAEDVSGSASKKPREDFFSPQVHHVDKDLQEKFDEALIEHITETCTSFAQYGESFQRLIHVISKKVKVKHPTSLSRMVDKSAEEVMKEITNIFRTVKDDLVYLGFTSDLWTSRTMDSYLSLTVSFIDRFIT